MAASAAVVGGIPAVAGLGAAKAGKTFVVAVGRTTQVGVYRNDLGASACAKRGLATSAAIIAGRATVAVLRTARATKGRAGITRIAIVVAIEEVAACIVRGYSAAVQEMVEACIFRWTSEGNGGPGCSEYNRGVSEFHDQNGDDDGFLMNTVRLSRCVANAGC